MLDWFTGYILCDASKVRTGYLTKSNDLGLTEWTTPTWTKTPGSFLSTIQLRPVQPKMYLLHQIHQADTPHPLPCPGLILQLSGNPTKFLQGHNIFGPPASTSHDLILATLQHLPRKFRPAATINPATQIHATRLDLATAVALGSHQAVHDFIEHIANNLRTRRHEAQVQGIKVHRPGIITVPTVYLNTPRSRWQIRIYCKACELHAHPPDWPELRGLATPYIQNQVRIELILRSRELMDLRESGTPIHENLIWEYWNRTENGTMKTDGLEKIEQLPWSIKRTLTLWKEGHNIKSELPKPTFYRHRHTILEQTGLDIAGSPHTAQDTYPRELLDAHFLQAHEVTTIPTVLNKYLWPSLDLQYYQPRDN